MKIIFTQEAFQKFRAYIHGIEYEISGFGKIEKRGEDLLITDIKIFDQTVSAGHTTMDAKALAAFWDELIVAGEDIGQWKLWWHSHVYMQAFFSQIDYDTIDEFDSEMPEDNWMLSIVANKLGKMLARIDVFEPIRCAINDIGWDVERGEEIEVDVKQEIEAKVTIGSHRREQKKSLISWLGPRPSLPPMVKDGKPLSYEERFALFKATGTWPDSSTDIIDLIPVP